MFRGATGWTARADSPIISPHEKGQEGLLGPCLQKGKYVDRSRRGVDLIGPREVRSVSRLSSVRETAEYL
jgi:hypothetical protein